MPSWRTAAKQLQSPLPSGPPDRAPRAAAGGAVLRWRDRHAGRRSIGYAARGRGRIRRLRDLQVRGPRAPGTRDRRGHDAFRILHGSPRPRSGLGQPMVSLESFKARGRAAAGSPAAGRHAGDSPGWACNEGGRHPGAAGRLRRPREHRGRRLGAEAREVRVPARPRAPRRTDHPRRRVHGDDARDRTEGLAEPLRALVPRRHARARYLRGHDHARSRAPRPAGHQHLAGRFRTPVRSFEADVDLSGSRAGRCTPCSSEPHGWPSTVPRWRCWESVEDHPVAIRQGNMIAVSFHPELAGDGRLHELLLEDERPRRES